MSTPWLPQTPNSVLRTWRSNRHRFSRSLEKKVTMTWAAHQNYKRFWPMSRFSCPDIKRYIMVSWIFPFQENLIDIEIEIQFSLFSNLYKIFIFHISVPIFIRIFGATMPLLFPRQNSSPTMWRLGLLPGSSTTKLPLHIKQTIRLFGWHFPRFW